MESPLSLHWPGYRLFPYEQKLAIREVEALLSPTDLISRDDRVDVRTNCPPACAGALTYFSSVTQNGHLVPTAQSMLEGAGPNGGGGSKQSTRYSVHGLHEYKGKFNPQVAHAILNCFRLAQDARVLDPFCGSGTSLVESSHKGIRAIGLDLNPLAIFIATAKLKALRTPAADIEKALERSIRIARRKNSGTRDESPRSTYLSSWFDEGVLRKIESLRAAIEEEAPNVSQILKVILSDLLREFSFQDPLDLRIRRRKTPLPSLSPLDALDAKAHQFVKSLQGVQSVLKRFGLCTAVHTDATTISHSLERKLGSFDAVISSPPYATALPYIDTQRLSLVWLGLCEPSEIPRLQAELIGSREFYGSQKSEGAKKMASNAEGLPRSAHDFCIRLQKAVSPKDGFRRKAVPSLLYRYLVGMQGVFHSLLRLMKPGAQAAFIVGHNHTVLGGQRFDIDTPYLLAELARGCGFDTLEQASLETYQRYGLHYKNAVSKEELLLFRRR